MWGCTGLKTRVIINDILSALYENLRVFAIDYALNAQCVRQSPPASQIRVVSYLVPWLFSLFWAQYAHAQSNPFYHPFYPDVTHVRKDTRSSLVSSPDQIFRARPADSSKNRVWTLSLRKLGQVYIWRAVN